jgi:hypothetical protein
MANSFIPVELAKGVLSTVSSVLTLIKVYILTHSISVILITFQTTIENKDDFIDVCGQCDKITMMLWRATSGKSESEVAPAILRALTELQRSFSVSFTYLTRPDVITHLLRSVNGILEAVQAKIQSHFGSQVFHATVNRELISKWQQELDRFLLLFNVCSHYSLGSQLY